MLSLGMSLPTDKPLGSNMTFASGLGTSSCARTVGDSYAMGWFVRNDSMLGYGIFDAPGDTLLFASLNVLFPRWKRRGAIDQRELQYVPMRP